MLCIPDQLWIRSILSGNALRSACPFEAQLIRQADAEGSALSLTLLERGSSPTLPRMPNALTQHGPRPRGCQRPRTRPRRRRVLHVDYADTDLPGGLEWLGLGPGSHPG